MECKGGSKEKGRRDQERFNRYIVECKEVPLAKPQASSIDLIDTLWNVKFFAVLARSYSLLELIATLRTVKTIICVHCIGRQLD